MPSPSLAHALYRSAPLQSYEPATSTEWDNGLMDKDPSITEIVERLLSDLGPEAFVTLDYWDDDLCAVGVARPSDHRYLVYISTFPSEAGKISYECESPPTEPGMPYSSDGMVESASYTVASRSWCKRLGAQAPITSYAAAVTPSSATSSR